MMFIELREMHYKNGGYTTYPICCNTEEISNIQDCDGGYGPDYRLITMRNGKQYKVLDSYKDIVAKLK